MERHRRWGLWQVTMCLQNQEMSGFMPEPRNSLEVQRPVYSLGRLRPSPPRSGLVKWP